MPVPYALSDIDLVAIRADLSSIDLPDGTSIGPRVIVEAKAELERIREQVQNLE